MYNKSLILLGHSYDEVKAIVAGWGRMWSGGDNSRFLQETKVVVQPEETCKTTRIGFLLEPKTMICGYAKNADACQGDSGGPLFIETSFNRFEQFGKSIADDAYMYIKIYKSYNFDFLTSSKLLNNINVIILLLLYCRCNFIWYWLWYRKFTWYL